MWFKEFISKNKGTLIVLALLAVAFFSGKIYEHHRIYSEMIPQIDTITKIVPVYKDFPEPQKAALVGYVPVPKYKFLTDTLTQNSIEYLHDTTIVYLPREQKYYEEEEGSLRMWVSGYEPRLDRYELDKKETVITQTVVEKASRWGLSIAVGGGASYYNKSVILAPQITVGLSYTFLRF